TGQVDDSLWSDGDIAVTTKAGLAAQNTGMTISSVTGAGINQLPDELYERLSLRVSGAGLVSRQRQLSAIRDARDTLQQVDDLPPEILAELIRQTAVSLDRLLGRIGAEEYLDVIFSSFCIGK